jgi:hypothetical protein
MSSVIIKGDTSGQIALSAPAVAGTNTLTLPTITGTISTLNSGTAVASTSGTSIDFTGIPAGVRRITVMFSGVSLSGTSQFLVQLGDAGGIETTGYVSGSANARSAAATIGGSSTSGFLIYHGSGAGNLFFGSLRLEFVGSNIWVGSLSGGTGSNQGISGGGDKTLSDTLDRLRITTVNGTDTFDAGSINILYE